MDDDDQADNVVSAESPNKQSKRDRFKGALVRTKSKFKKENKLKETALPDDVNDFLAAGRTSTSSLTSAGDTLPHHPTISTIDVQSASASSASPRPSTSDSSTHPFASQRSPKKIPIPKIDVSTAQRWPHAQRVGTNEQDLNDFLRPEYQERSQSASSFSKKPKQKGRRRGLSVSFLEAPPTVIGEGGDDAPTPPVEIGRARQRARSVSPMPSRTQAPPEASTNGTYGKRPSPGSPPPRQAHTLPDALRPRMLSRVQTGLESMPTSASGLDKEFEMTLRMGPHAHSPISAGGSPQNSLEIVAPKPIRIVQPPPVFEELIGPHGVKKGVASTNLREKFREGDALRMHLDQESPAVVDGVREGRPLRRVTSQGMQEPSH